MSRVSWLSSLFVVFVFQSSLFRSQPPSPGAASTAAVSVVERALAGRSSPTESRSLRAQCEKTARWERY
jgi:hypothetical protein